jgi:hypothetical protein
MELIPTTYRLGSGDIEWNFNEIEFTSDKFSTSLIGCDITKTIHLKKVRATKAISTHSMCWQVYVAPRVLHMFACPCCEFFSEVMT